MFIVGSQLNVGEVVSSCAARGRYYIIRNFDGRKVVDCLVEMCYSSDFPSVLLRWPMKSVSHGGNTISVRIVASDEAGAFSLDFFNC